MPSKPNPPQGRTLTGAYLTATVYGRMTITMEVSAGLAEMMLAEIADAMSRGEDVKPASFGGLQPAGAI
jgi:hypothetical protein